MMIDWAQLKTAEQLIEEARKAAVPEAISRAQGKAALIQAGVWEHALAFVDGLPPTDKAMAEVALNDTVEWRRDSGFLAACAAGIGLSVLQLDELFVAAAQIQF